MYRFFLKKERKKERNVVFLCFVYILRKANKRENSLWEHKTIVWLYFT